MSSEAAVDGDLVAPLVRLLDSALRRLGEAGCQDEACRIAAEAWALMEPGRAREALRLNGTLHYLTRPPPSGAGVERNWHAHGQETLMKAEPQRGT